MLIYDDLSCFANTSPFLSILAAELSMLLKETDLKPRASHFFFFPKGVVAVRLGLRGLLIDATFLLENRSQMGHAQVLQELFVTNIWRVPKIGDPPNGWFIMENPI